MKVKWFVIGAAMAGVLQTAALGSIILDRADLLRNGSEVVLQSEMVDPRDLFRGHYVVLNLAISRIDAAEVVVEGKLQTGQDVWVSLKKGEDEFWIADTLYAELPESPTGPIIRGEYDNSSRVMLPGPDDGEMNQGMHSIRFPVDRFFAEENRAKDLEKVRRDRNLGVVVALSDDGDAAIKGISVEGELIYVESVW